MADWTPVQSKQIQGGGATTQAVTFTSTVTSGHVVFGAALFDPATPSKLTSVTDDKGNKYLVTSYGENGTLGVSGFYSSGLITNAPQTITLHFSSSASTAWITIDEFTPPTGTTAISLDGGQNNPGAGLVAGTTSGSWQNNQNDVLVYSANFNTGTATPGTGMTALQGSGTAVSSAYKIQASPSASTSAAWTNTGTPWITAYAIAPVAPTWGLIQNTTIIGPGGAGSQAVSFPAAVTSGNIVIGSIHFTLSLTISTVTDDKGNNYTVINTVSGTDSVSLFWSNGFLTNGPSTITVTYSGTGTTFLTATEWKPPSGTVSVAVDGQHSATANNAGPAASGNITPTKNGDLIFGAGLLNGSMSPSGGFSALSMNGQGYCDSYYIQPTAGAIQSQYTTSLSTTWEANVAAFSATVSTTGAFTVSGWGVHDRFEVHDVVYTYAPITKRTN